MLNAIKNMFATPVAVDFMVNDPSKPVVAKNEPLVNLSKFLKFSVAGFTGKSATQVSSLAWQANQAYITLSKTIGAFQNVVPQRKWAATNDLKVYPRAGNDMNAYYDRKNLKFFYAADPKTRQMIYMADSTDVVAHELGHALLDALRPDFWSVQALEIWAFHEGWADWTAMNLFMQYPAALDFVLAETGGNLRKSNTLSRLAEQAGIAIYNMTDGATLSYALRDAVNTFKYSDPNVLPQDGPDNVLTGECHSFGRLWAAIMYDILCGMYEKQIAKNPAIAKRDAFIVARDTAWKYLVKSAIRAPRVTKYYQGVANMMMTVDKEAGSPYQDVLKIAFANRKISVSTPVKMLSVIDRDDIDGGHEVQSFEQGILVPQKKMVKLGKFVRGAVKMQAADGTDLSNVEVEIAADKYYQTDSRRNIIGEISSSEEEQIDAALAAVQHIKAVGHNEMWDIVDNKLVRKQVI